jgi:hypothetical protein
VAVVVGPDLTELSAKFEGGPNGAFNPADLKHKEARHLIIEAMSRKPFPKNARVLVRWGKRRQKVLDPTTLSKVGIFGEESDCLVPNSSNPLLIEFLAAVVEISTFELLCAPVIEVVPTRLRLLNRPT